MMLHFFVFYSCLVHWSSTLPVDSPSDRKDVTKYADTVADAHVQNTANHVQAHWVYTNTPQATDELPPAHWNDAYPKCAGARQSPIEIDVQSAVIDLSLEPLNFSSYHTQPVANNWTVHNNGHSVTFTAKFDSTPVLWQGSLGAVYGFSQFHFHWGSNDARGSEHVIDHRRFPLELHLVHRKISESREESHADSTGLSVVGVVFEVHHEAPNIHMDALTQAVQQAINPDAPVSLILPDLNLVDLIPDHQDYYRYLGSLTTPPCDESVVWNVMKTPLRVTEDQLSVFRSLHQHAGTDAADDRLADNYRPLQNPNGRVVRYHPDMMDSANTVKVQESTTPGSSGSTTLSPFSINTLFLLLIIVSFMAQWLAS